MRPGAAADLLVVADDPLKDLATLERPLWVMAAGRVAAQNFPEHPDRTDPPGPVA